MNQPSRVYSFAIDLPLYQLFDYRVAEGTSCTPGQRFIVPFGNRQKVALLTGPSQAPLEDAGRIKAVIEPLDKEALLSTSLLQLAEWTAKYYCQPLAEVLFLCLPRYCRQPRRVNSTGMYVWFARNIDSEALASLSTPAPRQFQILQAIMDSPEGLNAAQLGIIHPGWRQQVKALQRKDLIYTCWKENLVQPTDALLAGPELTRDQQRIIDDITPQLDRFSVQLIQGVTGSGKTEIYLELIQKVIARGKQVIYLVPEIGLTPQLLQRLQQRLGSTVVISHSAQGDFERYQSWDQFKRGVVKVITGTRSALFSDSTELGMIIIDEEHDASYRQQDGLRYHARDVAIKRAQMLDIPIVLGSATPSPESLQNLAKPYYRLHRLDRRPNDSRPPTIQLIDTSKTPLESGCSARMIRAMENHLAASGQVLLYLNRRGFAPLVMCHECGWRADCQQCDARLTLHRSMGKLICHHCGLSQAAPSTCPECAASDIFHYGVGTQQLESYLTMRFPHVPVIRIDRDSVTVAQPLDHKLRPVQSGEPCILVGTQMLAKGHDYPNITLVGILDADQALHSSFYRATERLLQTVLQVAGRAGRAAKGGQALLQTAFPTHPLMHNLCSQDYSQLIQPMLEERKLLGFPPFVRVASFLADAIQLDLAMTRLHTLKQNINALAANDSISIIGPIPSLMTRRKGRYRAQLSILARDIQPLRALLNEMMPVISTMRNTPKCRLVVEVDPLDL